MAAKPWGHSEIIKEQVKKLKAMKGYSVSAGWFETARYQAAKGVPQQMVGVPIATIAKINEYGASIQRGKTKVIIPARPFMRLAAQSIKKKGPDVTRKLARKIVDGKIDIKQALAQLGMFMEGEIVNSIKNGGWVRNAPSTIKKKGFDKPLIDTAQMWQSVSSKVSEPK